MDETTVTTTQTPAPAPLKRGAIIGTAPTWKLTPWHDLTLDLFGLNDAYQLGFPRASGWFDLHRTADMVFHDAAHPIRQEDIPVGGYLRPFGHLDWIRKQPFPVWMAEPHPEWPNARLFPRDEIQASFGQYFSSTPAWMLAWMIREGYKEIHIYGIHLATAWEYTEQRPNLEFLVGLALSRGVNIVIPSRSPLLKARSVYAYEPKADLGVQRQEQRVAQIKTRGARLRERLAALPWYAVAAKADLRAELTRTDAILADARVGASHQQARAWMGS